MPVRKRRLKVKTYEVIRRAVEEGVARGIRRAFKHSDRVLTGPEEERLREAVETAVMGDLSEVVNFDE